MSESKVNRLFEEFPGTPTEKWEEEIIKDLKGADYDKKLVWKTFEGFEVNPYYRAENLRDLKYIKSGIESINVSRIYFCRINSAV